MGHTYTLWYDKASFIVNMDRIFIPVSWNLKLLQ